MKTFKNKILLSYFLLFLLFITALYPVIRLTTQQAQSNVLKKNISSLVSNPQEAEMILKTLQAEETREFNIAFLWLSLGNLFLFGLISWLIFNYFMRPMREIMRTIRPYQRGEVDRLPKIELKRHGAKDEFDHLAETLNGLSDSVQEEMNIIVGERNDKEAILESLGEGVVALDPELKLVFMNRMAQQILNLNEDELRLKNLPVPLPHPKYFDLIQRARKIGQPVQGIMILEGKKKTYLDVIVVPRKNRTGVILVLQDKTNLHKILELGRDFIANASHELKTPITIIRGFAETLYDHPELSRETYMDIMKKIFSNCQRMETLVKNLLALAAVEEGLPHSRLHECNIIDLIGQTRQTVLVVHPTALIDILPLTPEPLLLMADGDLLHQAILNLLDNAVKYSKPPAHIRVTVERKEQSMIIKITDRGIGIPPEDVDKIFERFYAVDKSYSRSLGGSGLGLSIVERIIEKHQGTIELASQLGVGSTFTITLPTLEDHDPFAP